jgi:hypothetical protein
MSVTHVGVELKFADIEVHETGGVDVLVFNDGPGDIVIGGHFHDNAKGGLEIIGPTRAPSTSSSSWPTTTRNSASSSSRPTRG